VVSRKGEAGAVAVMAALILTVLLLIAAFLIDLGALRADASANQAAADMAAAAGAQEYVSFQEGSLEEACREALIYAGRNLDLDLDPDACTDLPAMCDPSADSPETVTVTAGPYTITVTNPVQDNDALMDGRSTDESTPCQRLGVSVERERDFLFARAAGAGDQGATIRGAVARSLGGDFEGAALIILRPEGTNNQSCRVLRTTGGNVTIEVTRGDQGEPGIITVDSRSQGCQDSGSPLLNPSSSSSATDPAFLAADRIFSNALRFGDSGVNDQHEGIAPQPVLPGPPVTRYEIDHRYNCPDNGSYEDGPDWSPETWYPAFTMYPDGNDGGICSQSDEHTSPEPYLKNLHDTTVTTDLEDASGWGYIDDCDTDTTYGPGVDHDDAGGDGLRFYVDCAEFSPDGGFVNATHVVIEGRHNGGLTRGSFTNTSDQGTVIVVRNGGIDQDGPLTIDRSFLYLAGTDGTVDIGGGNNVDWAGLTVEAGDDCVSTPIPTASCFAPLSLWANQDAPRTAPFIVRGNATGAISGTFFTPNAVVEFRGMDGDPKIEFEGSQFFAQVLQGRGGGSVQLKPDKSTMVDTTPFGRSLIR
jgi:hypothetical protein